MNFNTLLGIFVLFLVSISLITINEGVEYDTLVNSLETSRDNALFAFDYEDPDAHGVMRIFYAYLHMMMFVLFEICLLALSFAVANPDLINPYLFLNLIKILFFGYIFYYIGVPLFKLGVIIFLLVKEYYQNKKEKQNAR